MNHAKTCGCWSGRVIRHILIFACVLLGIKDSLLVGEEGNFEEFEIRVIRPRYFSKRNRFEVGVEPGLITNQTFIYTYLFSGVLGYHFTETWGVEAYGTYGVSSDKDEKRVLKDDFDINTLILRTESIVGINVQWTPAYGKYQLRDGTLVYFDTVLFAGGGMTGIKYKYDHCFPPTDSKGRVAGEVRPDRAVAYPSMTFGVGQRFFLDKDSALKWDIRDNVFSVDTADGDCSDGLTGEQALQHNLTVQLGYSYFL